MVLGRWNPVAAEWQTRFRGFISDWDYSFDPSQNVNRLTLSLVDMFEILNSIQMQPGFFGDTPPAGNEGEVFYDNENMGDRILHVLADSIGATPTASFAVVFTGNVGLYEGVYSPGESPMTAIQEAADAEFPGVSNVYTDRFGRIVAHGRLAKFDPATIAVGAGDEAWDWHHWHCGDGAAVALAPSTTAHIREFSFNRGLSKIVNQATATPILNGDPGLPLTGAEIAAQTVQDGSSIGIHGIRAWSAENLLTKTGLLDSSDALTECLKFANFQLANYSEPKDRVTLLGFKSMRPDWVGAAATWRVLCEADIADLIGITITSPGGGGFDDQDFDIEGIHETNEPLNGDYDMVTMTLDVSPQPTNPSIFPTA